MLRFSLGTVGALSLALIFGAATTVVAHQASADTAASDIPFDEWLRGVRLEAGTLGISESTLASALDGIQLIPRVIELDRNQPEFSLTLREYFERVAPESRIEKGRAKLAENRALLEAASARFGVEPQIIVALWGIETDFGRVSGGFKVVPALATLAHDGRRSSYFRGELMNALKIIDAGHISANDMMGSWAGAMGQCQFMPSSFLNFAVDGDRDGRKDIWSNPADVFASAASLLAGNGWRSGQRWGRPVRLPDVFDLGAEGLEYRKSLAEWQALGIRNRDRSDLPVAEAPGLQASLVLPDGPDGPAFLVYDNYRAILKWNRSHFFALTAGYLADRIAGENTVLFGE